MPKHRKAGKTFLKGGVWHARGISPKGTFVDEIKSGRILGNEGVEGTVTEIDVTVKGAHGRNRKLKMVEKDFFDRKIFSVGPSPLMDPKAQFKIMNSLIKLNREKKLGLRIVRTIRLRKKDGKYTLIMTKLNITPYEKLTQKQRVQFFEDYNMQANIAEKYGYSIGYDAFFPLIDPKDPAKEKVIAVIADFGNVEFKPVLRSSRYF